MASNGASRRTRWPGPGAVVSQLGLTTALTITLWAMTREGLLRRRSAEVYAVAENP